MTFPEFAQLQMPAADSGWRPWPSLTWVKTTKAGSAVEDPANLLDEDIRSGMGYHWRRCEERILMLEKGKVKLNKLGWKNVLLGPRAGKGDFPTQKPREVIRRLIENSTQPGDLVLDPFCGSGVVGSVAQELGRRAVLIDVDASAARELLRHQA